MNYAHEIMELKLKISQNEKDIFDIIAKIDDLFKTLEERDANK
jgi:hypothetical protein